VLFLETCQGGKLDRSHPCLLEIWFILSQMSSNYGLHYVAIIFILNDIHDLMTFITNKQNTKRIWEGPFQFNLIKCF
jgi:uncharacterized membrane protein